MRAILSKVVAVSMIASAGLLVTACGGSEANNTTTVTTDTNVTENVVSEDMTGMTNATDTTTNVTETTSNTTTTGNTM
jgi:hypothetical protein